MGKIKELFSDSFYSWLLRGAITGLCIVFYDAAIDVRREFRLHGRTLTRHDAKLSIIELRLKNLEDKKK